ncbi:MAG: hypothetical protein GXN92_01290 [Candidatus Micrarchaeota archaeon]|nr:hypothetical protein [Candidatus Micrarchaeota archaeon]
MKKGQAGIEYLAIYGVALLIIVIVIAVLLNMFGAFGQNTVCVGEPKTFQCADNVFQVTDVNNDSYAEIGVKLYNGNLRGIKVYTATCYEGKEKPDRIRPTSYEPNGISIGAGDVKEISGVECYNRDGSRLEYQPGKVFDGVFEFKYKYDNDLEGAPLRTGRLYITTRMD